MPLEREALLLAIRQFGLKLLPNFTASYVQWLAEHGVDLS